MTPRIGSAFASLLISVAAATAAGQPATGPATGPATRPASSPARQASRPATRPATPEELARLVALGNREVGVHDPSTIVRDGDFYYSFITANGVGVIRSSDLRAWTPLPSVFDAPPAWVAEAVPGNRGHFWAPDVVRAADGRWLLYYSISTFGKNTSAIALATNKTLDPASPDFAWKDEGIVVRSSAEDRFNAIDPALTFDADGRLWMSFGSFWDGIKMIELDPATGLRKGDAPPATLAWHREIEAPFIHRHDGKYYLFVNWGICCRGVRSTYEVRVGRGDAITGPYLDKDGKDLAAGGGTRLVATDGPMIGPGHPGIVADAGGAEQFSFHFYDATQNGRPTLGLRPLTWDADGWPVVGEWPALP